MGARAITQRRGLRHAAVQGVATAPGRKDRVLLSVQPADWSVGLFASLTLVALPDLLTKWHTHSFAPSHVSGESLWEEDEQAVMSSLDRVSSPNKVISDTSEDLLGA